MLLLPHEAAFGATGINTTAGDEDEQLTWLHIPTRIGTYGHATYIKACSS